MKKGWMITIALIVLAILIILLLSYDLFDVWTFVGMVFYVLLFIGGYIFISVGTKDYEAVMREESARKQKFDYCWEHANMILRRLPGGEGLEWASGFGRKSEFRNYHDGVQNRPFRSMLGYLSQSQLLVLIIYDIERDDIVRFVTNPDPDIIESPFRNFRPFSRGTGARVEDYDEYGRPYSPIYQRKSKYKHPIAINIGGGGDDTLSNNEMRQAKPDDDMIESAVKRIKE